MKSSSILLCFIFALFLQSCGKNLTTKAEIPVAEITTFSYPIGKDSTLELTYGETFIPLVPTRSPNIFRCEISPSPLPIGLNFDSRTCALHGTPVRPADSTVHLESQFDIRTFASATASTSNGSWTLAYRILQPAPVLNFGNDGNIGNKAVGNEIVISNLASSLSGPISTCIVDKALPMGLSLSQSTCEISGRVNTEVASTTYKITATGAGGTAESNISFAFVFNPPTLTYGSIPTSISLNSATNMSPSSKAGTDHCSISPPLPTGLNFNTTTCAISGAPTVASASKSYAITAFPGPGESAPTSIVNFTLEVKYNAPSLSYPIPIAQKIGTLFSLNPNVKSGVDHCSILPAALPAGLSFNETTCAVAGTPTAVTSVNFYTITAYPGPGVSSPTVSTNFNLEVSYNTPILIYSSAAPAVIGSAYSLIASPKNGVDHCSISPPLLPAGLSFDTTSCAVAGTPTAASDATLYTVTAYPGPGASAPTATANFSLGVSYPTPTLSYENSLAFPLIAVPYSHLAITKTGVDHCVISPPLPAGLVFNNSTCEISGTATAPTIATLYEVIAYPGPGNSAPTVRANLSLQVTYRTPALSYSINNSAEVGTAYTLSPITKTGVDHCTISPPLPEGLTLDSSSCEISGAPVNGNETTSYSVTAYPGPGNSTPTASAQFVLQISYGLIPASGTLAGYEYVNEFETVTIGSVTYTFRSRTLYDEANTIYVGYDISSAFEFLASAINNGGGSDVGGQTVPHPDVIATLITNDQGLPEIILTAKQPGVCGNQIITTATLTNGGFSNATLSGGTGGSLDNCSSLPGDPGWCAEVSGCWIAEDQTCGCGANAPQSDPHQWCNHNYPVSGFGYIAGQACVAIPGFHCGNSQIDALHAETCDDGNTNNGDGCDSLCHTEGDYDITSTGSNVTINPSGNQRVADGAMVSFTVTANPRFTRSDDVIVDNCSNYPGASGSWSGNVYTWGPVYEGSCVFTFSAVGSAANWCEAVGGTTWNASESTCDASLDANSWCTANRGWSYFYAEGLGCTTSCDPVATRAYWCKVGLEWWDCRSSTCEGFTKVNYCTDQLGGIWDGTNCTVADNPQWSF